MCNKTYSLLTRVARLRDHLRTAHNIYNAEKLDWKDKFNLLWRYFIQDIAEVKCIICGEQFLASHHQYPMQEHLKNKHLQVIDQILQEIRSTWLSPYFILNMGNCNINCINCRRDFKIFLGTNGSYSHLLQFHNIQDEYSGNYASSHHDNTH